MNVEWTPQARSAVIETMIYIEETFGTKTMLDFADAIAESEMYLARDPYMFKIEPLLESCADTFRSLLVKKINKIIYRIDNNCVYIVDFWNLRMSPKKLQNRIKD
jgi:plasmid stabilization system protein ParE